MHSLQRSVKQNDKDLIPIETKILFYQLIQKVKCGKAYLNETYEKILDDMDKVTLSHFNI